MRSSSKVRANGAFGSGSPRSCPRTRGCRSGSRRSRTTGCEASCSPKRRNERRPIRGRARPAPDRRGHVACADCVTFLRRLIREPGLDCELDVALEGLRDRATVLRLIRRLLERLLVESRDSPLDLERRLGDAGAAHQVALPGHLSLPVRRHHIPPSRVVSNFTSALPRTSAAIVHPSSAAAAVRSNVCASIPGTRPSTLSSTPMTRWRPSTSSTMHTAETSSRSGGVPAPVSSPASDMAKQPPTAAASNSSGLVLPSGEPTRVASVYGSSSSAPLRPEIAPAPRARFPSQRTSAVRVTRGKVLGHHFDAAGLARQSPPQLEHPPPRADRVLDLVGRLPPGGQPPEPQ